MSTAELPKKYDFASVEQRIYQWWEENGYFKPSNDPQDENFDPDQETFVIAIPPPNVTGVLHLGHAMFLSVEDLMIRYHRMKGYSTLWVPGTDHAGIATQLQVEKSLRAEGLSREEIGREAFLKRAWAWKEEHGGKITQQTRRMGSSCDWDRERFTLDEGLSKAVREAFVRLYDKGLIYRGPRLINWSPGLKTAVSDLEVEYSEEPGKLYYFKYILSDDSEQFIPVATTRPETILGDTAVAVHPEDDRYKAMIGKKVLVPILGREIPVIADTYVDREFGTGALKITPAHDPNDYEIGMRHNLELINIMDDNACINENGEKYNGQDRFECRENLWDDMQAAGLVIKEDPYTLKVPRSQRGGEIIEPRISTQWFVKIKPMADNALRAVEEGEVQIVPEFFTKVYNNWLENIQDWCISRQLWWGHQIPVWYCKDCGAMTVAREDPDTCSTCQSTDIEQESDVLDTWFSSGLWPFSTLGWPEETPDLAYYYPTAVLETGYDILFFWVARMIMSGLEFTGKAPFHTVYLHGLIRDEHGQKMSKSKDNVIDPLLVMDELGTDALRFTLLVGSSPGNDMNLSVKKVETNRNFANKLWNAGRFILGTLPKAPKEAQNAPDWTLPDSWIWARMKQLISSSDRLFQNYQYGEAGRQILDFFWGEFADWYLEIAKLQIAEGGDRAYYTAYTLVKVFDNCLRLLHPFTPFVTEELWGHLKTTAQEHSDNFAPGKGWEEALIIASWPEDMGEEGWEDEKIANFVLVQDIVRSIRNLRAEKKIDPGQKIPATFVAGERTEMLKAQSEFISGLSHLDRENITFLESLAEKPNDQISLVVSGIEIFLSLESLVDSAAEKERIQKELKVVESQISRIEKLLGSEFAKKAPAHVVENERKKLETFKESAQKLKEQLG
ncbi:MAG: valine--tRNA ligase [Anaerolineaceae bacterium]|nr:valine--tRNA ligase [Anaerolineaceae bacterium]